jgi:GDPmannose 4,6-dehydratase
MLGRFEMKTALITGIGGQDGRHLGELLVSKGYTVYGMLNGQRNDGAHLVGRELPSVIQVRGDLADSSSLARVLEETQPDEVYNLAAISFVGMSFSQPELTANITGLGVLRLLEAIRATKMQDKVRFYQASSSEMFGKVQTVPQNEKTIFYPRSPYGVAKVFAHYSVVNYREAYGMHASCGILFNHEGEKRGMEFVTRKITNSVARIKLGLQSEIRLGDLSPRRDWGYAGDYVEAMWKMLQQDEPDDYVIATGETHSVQEFVDLSFKAAGMEGESPKYVVRDERFVRPSEVDLLVGDASKARNRLDWKPNISFESLVKRMVDHDIRIESQKI